MATLPNPLPKLAADPSGRTLGLELPAGRLIDATHDGPWHEPLLWCADEPAAPGAWAALAPARRTAGLLPVLLDVGGPHGAPEEWELMPAEASYPGDHDAEEVLAEFWEEYAADELSDGEGRPGEERAEEVFGAPASGDGTVAPFGPVWPGLAPAARLTTDAGSDAGSDSGSDSGETVDPDAHAAGTADSLTTDGSWLKEPRLALVPARRSADIPAALGWSGPLNHESDPARLCAVLRSWEDRYGIRVVALTFDRLVLSVAAPPTTPAEAEAVAAEHFAFCPDNITQGHHETLRAYAAHEVLNQRTWSFWWD
ncbi:DUF4253 domain-containing protein [Streptomyces avermitilis]|uniref:DUF4253 domain-containing protein n=1 Tax=Streptomyces avermitilis TaxID=33903 RepID=UPI0033B0A5E2